MASYSLHIGSTLVAVFPFLPPHHNQQSTWPLFEDQSFPETSDGGCQRLKGYKQAVHRLLAHTVVKKIWEFHMQIHISGFS